MNVTWKNCFRIGLSVFILYLCIVYSKVVFTLASTALSAAAPLIIGCIIAYLVNITMSFYEKYYFPNSKKNIAKKSRRPVCLILAVLSLIIVIVAIIAIVLPQLISCIKLILAKLPAAVDIFMNWLGNIDIVPSDIAKFIEDIDWKSRIVNLIEILTTGAGNVVDVVVNAVTKVFQGVITAIVSIVFAVYLLLAKDRIKAQFVRLTNRYIPEKYIAKLKYVLRIFDESFHGYFVAQCAEAAILGVLCTIGMMIFNIPYEAMIGALIGFTSLVPIVGAFIGAAIGALMILTISPFQALMFIIYIIILQQIEENLIYPKVVGTSVNLPGIWVLASITLGGRVLGVIGILIAVPLTAALYRILRDDINRIPKI